MSAYKVKHLHSGEEHERPAILVNNHHIRDKARWQTYAVDPAIEAFHRHLPDYAETTLHHLPSLAAELGVARVFLKDESTRFGLPAFKILGASWAVHRTVCEILRLPPTTSLEIMRRAVSDRNASMPAVRIVACTEGNWGRALTKMAKFLDISATIYVPGLMSEYTRNLLRVESAEVIVLDDGTYDDCIAAARDDAQRTGASLIMDTSWEGYERIPQVNAECLIENLRSDDGCLSGSLTATPAFLPKLIGKYLLSRMDRRRAPFSFPWA
jgi:diaminopropionate ammonia-lyase